MTTGKKDVIAEYILQIREQKLSFDEAVEVILEKNNVTTAPIPVVAIAKNLGFSVYSAGFKDRNITGIVADSSKPVKPFKEKRIIIYNRDDHSRRQNFAIAYGIAYFVLHCNSANNFYERYIHGSDKEQQSAIVQEANSFAIKLLMPKRMVQDVISNLPLSITRAQATAVISRKFFVSKKVADLRLTEIGYDLTK